MMEIGNKNIGNKKMINEEKLNKFFSLRECFSADILNHIIQNKDKFREIMKKSNPTKKYDVDPFTIAEKYLHKSSGGFIETKYRQNRGFGRHNAMGSLSLQNLPKQIRHCISKEYYTDIDMVNCHPVILSHICSDYNINCKLLNEYNKNREQWLENLSNKCDISRDSMKTGILSLLNGGSSYLNNAIKKDFPMPEKLILFEDEITNIHKLICEYKEKDFNEHKARKIEGGKDYNFEASFVNTLLCDMENDILFVMYEYYDSPKNCVLCFDGIMLMNNQKYDLVGCEKYVKEEIDIDIKLDVKPMDKGFKINQRKVKTYYDKNKSNIDTLYDLSTIDYHRVYTLKHIQNIIKKCIFPINNNGNTIFLTNNKIWNKDNEKFEVDIGRTTLKNLIVPECLGRLIKIINKNYLKEMKKYRSLDDKEKKKLKDKIPKPFSIQTIDGTLINMLENNTLEKFSRLLLNPIYGKKII